MIGHDNNVDMATERMVLDLLHRRYAEQAGNGPRYTVAEHVGRDVGARGRICDFMAQDSWPSTGLALHGHEVKTSRDDWLRERRQPEKAAPFMLLCDFWWLVATPNVVKQGELPDGWGLLEVGLGTLVTVTPAPRIDHERGDYVPGRDTWWTPKGFSVAFARAAARTSWVQAGVAEEPRLAVG